MRPLRLEIEGFTAFRNRTCIDFSELDLFAITGPTGAGKSSLIDAVCYALYGRIPRVINEVNSAISLGLDRMQVSLEFRANGRCYRVLRESKRRGAGNVRLEQERDGDWEPLADRSREVTQKIEEIVGLDYEAFIRSALLPQGQFQEFLAGSPERRRDVLDRLLRMDVYTRMQRRAGQEAQLLQNEVATIEGRLNSELAEATPETLAKRREQLQQAEREAQELAAAIESLGLGVQLARQLSEAQQEFQRQKASRDEAQRRLDAATAVVEGGDSRREQLESELDTVRKKLEANQFNDELFAALTGAANQAVTVERLTKSERELKARLAALTKEAAGATRAAELAAKAAEDARAALETAQSALEEARRHDLAAALQAGLKQGDRCPVCSGVIGELPGIEAVELATAQRAYDEARDNDAKAGNAATTAKTRAAVAESNLANVAAQAGQAEKDLAEATKQLAELLPNVKDPSLPVIRAALEQQKTARSERTQLQKQESDLQATLAAEEKRLQSARDEVAAASATLRAAEAALAQAQERSEVAAQRLSAAAAEHGWQEAAADVPAGRDPLPGLQARLAESQAAQAELLMRRGSLEEQVRRLEQDIELAKSLRAELAERKSQYDVAEDLSQMLRANRFQAFVQAEALRSLAEDGSRKLLELSAGRYELLVTANGQDFQVKDRWNADDVRSVRTLSGGETFLASLALALSLAETLPGLAPGRRLALDSIFLDEGFGALDPEALDRAADALDALRMEDRLVCVITHLKELADRMPARVTVIKSEDGSSLMLA